MKKRGSDDSALTAEDDAAIPDRAALLVVRAWVEASNGQFLARITSVADLLDGDERVTFVSTVDKVMSEVRKWLDEVSPG